MVEFNCLGLAHIATGEHERYNDQAAAVNECGNGGGNTLYREEIM